MFGVLVWMFGWVWWFCLFGCFTVCLPRVFWVFYWLCLFGGFVFLGVIVGYFCDCFCVIGCLVVVLFWDCFIGDLDWWVVSFASLCLVVLIFFIF